MMLMLTPTQLKARDRHLRFKRSIAEKAAALQRAKLKAVEPSFETMTSAMEAERATLDSVAPTSTKSTSPPAGYWFEILPPSRPTIDTICRAVCKYYDIRKIDFLSDRRSRNLARPRHVAMYLAVQLTRMSYPKIGARMGDRDHTTVMHGVKLIGRLMLTDWQIAYDVAALFELITGEAQ